MKTFSANLQSAFSQKITTIAQCIKIVRLDGTTYNFTNFDKNLTIDTELYKSSYAFNPSAFSSALGLQIENMEIEGAVDQLFIDDFDIIKNKFYGAEVWLFSIDYKNIGYGKNKILYGTIGEIEVTDKTFKMEIRGMSKKYTNLYSNYYGKICRARLGDDKCKVDISTEEFKVTGSVYNQDELDSSIETKYLKINFNTSSWLNELKLYEIQLLDRLGNNVLSTHLTTINIVEADDYKCNSDGIVRPITNLLDGDLATYLCISNQGSNYYFSNTIYIEFDKIVNISSIKIIDVGSGVKVDGLTLSSSIDTYTWISYFNNANMAAYRSGNTVNFKFGYLLTIEKVKRYRFYSNQVANFADNYFQYGYIEWLTGLNAGVQTEIVQSLSDGLIELAIPTPYNIHTDDTFNMYVGCNHLLIGQDGTPYTGHCFTKFKNVINFRGEPYLPNEDVILSGFVAAMNERNTEEDSTSAVLEPV